LSVASSLKPDPGEALPYAGGCVSTGCLHAVASAAVMALGTSLGGRDGYLIALPFWFFLGVFQWAYLAPVALVLGRLSFAGAKKGVWAGGLAVLALNALYWAGMGIATIAYERKAAEVKRFSEAHPIAHRRLVGTLAAIDARHVEVATPEGLVSVELRSTTYYLRRDPALGNAKAPVEDFRAGLRVSVDATSYDGGPLYAEYVTISENSLQPAPQSR
jgi:hypothetical protein